MNPFTFSPSPLYPFRMLMPGRNWSAGSEYMYIFQEQVKDDDVHANNNIGF
ncbi:MAG: hypothetical protein IPH61_12410 [Bacteroidetes bacterium]|nr:hypothetical protein [Bacteroidota bacterium]